ncbi:MAG TPA: IPT/TIG domain-containing protein [Verrucomicrobiae bacterium]|jgi:hypothetical protein
MKTPNQLLRKSFPSAFVLLLFSTITASFSALAQVPRIDSVNPNAGHIGTPVTISGANFSSTPADNIVYFGAVRAMVTRATGMSVGIWLLRATLADGSQHSAWIQIK